MDIKLIKLKVRRGTNDQRRRVTLDEGELGYTTDTQRLFVGTGLIFGGVPVSNKIHLPVTLVTDLTSVVAEIGDTVNTGTLVFQLTSTPYTRLSSWGNISTKPDNNTIFYNAQNQLAIIPNSLDSADLSITALSSTSVAITATQIRVLSEGISAFHFSSQSFGLGLSGGGQTNSPITLAARGISAYNIHPTTFGLPITSIDNAYTIGNRTISSVHIHPNTIASPLCGGGSNITPITIGHGAISANHISVNAVLSGLQGGEGTPLSLSIDPNIFRFDATKRLTGLFETIYNTATGATTTSSPLSIFNGSITEAGSIYSTTNSSRVQAITADSSTGDTTTINLTSAGFLLFLGGFPTRYNPNTIPQRYAIPVFKW